MSDNDTEVERIMTGRPPSSYGSMCSDEREDDDVEIQDDDEPQPIIRVSVPTRVKLRPDSPETAISSVTQDRRTSVHNEGVYVNVQKKQQDQEVKMEVEDDESFVHEEQHRPPRNDIQMEPSVSEPTPSLTPAADEFSLRYIFTVMLESLRVLTTVELGCFVRTLHFICENQLDFQQLEQEGVVDVLGVVDCMLEKWGKGQALNFTTRTLSSMNKGDIASELIKKCAKVYVQFELRIGHKRRYHSLYEGVCRPGQQRYIREVYVESPIVLNTPNDMGAAICTSELFSTREGEHHVRVVVTTGIPAIGHTVRTQMFIIDWLEEKVPQHFQFVFPLPGRDLHLVRRGDHTFLEFLGTFYPEVKHAKFLAQPDSTVLFIIDALELCMLPLDFQNNPSIKDITSSAPVDALITSLITGDLLPQACVWITTRCSTCRKIPVRCISRFTELKGFTDPQKDEYFTKRTKQPALGRRVLDRIKNDPDLYELCFLPLFSWIVSFGYERCLQNLEVPVPVPTLTTLYAQYIIVLTNQKIERYVDMRLDSPKWKDSDKVFLMKMGELALKMLQDGRSVFYENDVSCFELDMNDVTYRGGISSETNEPTKNNGRSFQFIHHNIQKFMAAMFVYVKFRMTGEDVLVSQPSRKKADRRVIDLYKPLLDRVLKLHEGSYDLFLRFMFGLATHETEMQLRGHLLPQYHPEPKGIEDVVKHAKKKIKENAVPARCRNLQVCLMELEEGRKTSR